MTIFIWVYAVSMFLCLNIVIASSNLYKSGDMNEIIAKYGDSVIKGKIYSLGWMSIIPVLNTLVVMLFIIIVFREVKDLL